MYPWKELTTLNAEYPGSRAFHTMTLCGGAFIMFGGQTSATPTPGMVLDYRLYDSAFHVTELIKTEGLTSVFKDFSARKVALRAETQEDMVDWSIKIKEISQELSAEP